MGVHSSYFSEKDALDALVKVIAENIHLSFVLHSANLTGSDIMM